MVQSPTTAITSDETFDSILHELDNMRNQFKNICQKVKYLKKNYNKRKNTNVKSGFVKPVHVSSELASFLEIENTEKVSRSYVNKKINEYIKNNNLQVETFKQTFTVDDQLSIIFGLDKGSVVNYFKMQTYLKHHYPKIVNIDSP